jgi:hypothetical protein
MSYQAVAVANVIIVVVANVIVVVVANVTVSSFDIIVDSESILTHFSLLVCLYLFLFLSLGFKLLKKLRTHGR